MILKICAVQSIISKNRNENLEKSRRFFEYAHKRKCNIISFPEIFLTGPLDIQEYDDEFVKNVKKTFSLLCRKYSMYGVMGSIIERIGSGFYNISYLFDYKGRIIGSYRKIHLVKNSEAKKLKAGKDVVVVKTKLGVIGIQICRDLLYPEITREMMLRGAEIVFCPSFWCMKSKGFLPIYNKKYFADRVPREVDYLASARAIENSMVFVYNNAGGRFKKNKSDDVLLGRTQVALPFYGTVKRIKGNKESALIVALDKGIIKDARRVYSTNED